MQKKELLSIILLFFVITVVFFYPIFKGYIPFPGDLLSGNYAPYNSNTYDGIPPGGVPHKAQGVDVIRQLFPWKAFSVDQLSHSQIPLWNPYNFAGSPLLANFQSGVFYPLNSLFFLLPFLTAWTIYIFLTPFLSGIFLYLFLRELKLSKKAGIWAGLVFAFSSYMVVWMEWGNVTHTFLWLSLILFCVEKLITTQFRVRYIIMFVISLVFSLLAGYIQGYFYILLIVLSYYFFRVKQSSSFSFTKHSIFLTLLITPFFLCLFQILPTLELFRYSARGNYSPEQIEKLLNPLWYTITTLIPNFFGNPASRNHWFWGTYIERVSYFGLIPFIFALLAILHVKKRREVLFFGSLFFISLFLSIEFVLTKFVYLLPIPILSTTVPTRILSVFVFAGAILSGFGLDYLFNNKSKKELYIAVGITCAILLGAVGYVWIVSKAFTTLPWVHNLPISLKNSFLQFLILGAFILAVVTYNILIKQERLQGMLQKGFVIFLFLITIADLFYFFQKITPFSPTTYIFPRTDVFEWIKEEKTIDRVWGYGSGYIDTNFQTYEKVFSTDGYDPLFVKRYGEFLAVSKDGKIPKTLPRSDANIYPGFGTNDLRNNSFRQRALDLTSVRFVLHKYNEQKPDFATFPEQNYILLWQKGEWQIYENKNALPRFVLADKYIVKKDKKAIIDTLYNPSFPFSTTVVLEENIPKNFRFTPDPSATVTLKAYTPNLVSLSTKAKEDALLFLSDAYFPGWKVSIDEKDAKIYRANYAFRAVPVPKGEHIIIFAYHPQSFTVGVFLSAISLVFFTLMLLMLSRKAKHV